MIIIQAGEGGRGTPRPPSSELLLAEIGPDMSRFISEAYLAKWAKLCPGNHESAGKRYSGRTGQGNNWLRTGLIQAARAGIRCQEVRLVVLSIDDGHTVEPVGEVDRRDKEKCNYSWVSIASILDSNASKRDRFFGSSQNLAF